MPLLGAFHRGVAWRGVWGAWPCSARHEGRGRGHARQGGLGLGSVRREGIEGRGGGVRGMCRHRAKAFSRRAGGGGSNKRSALQACVWRTGCGGGRHPKGAAPSRMGRACRRTPLFSPPAVASCGMVPTHAACPPPPPFTSVRAASARARARGDADGSRGNNPGGAAVLTSNGQSVTREAKLQAWVK